MTDEQVIEVLAKFMGWRLEWRNGGCFVNMGHDEWPTSDWTLFSPLYRRDDLYECEMQAWEKGLLEYETALEKILNTNHHFLLARLIEPSTAARALAEVVQESQ